MSIVWARSLSARQQFLEALYQEAQRQVEHAQAAVEHLMPLEPWWFWYYEKSLFNVAAHLTLLQARWHRAGNVYLYRYEAALEAQTFWQRAAHHLDLDDGFFFED